MAEQKLPDVVLKGMRRKCKITVLETKWFPEHALPYIKGPCEEMKAGDVFITTGATGEEMPEGFCPLAWQAIAPQAQVLADGGKVFGALPVHVACCPDGARPVIYRMEAYDEE